MELGIADSALDEGDLPGHFCPECTAVRYAGEPSCSSCRAGRPESGWPSLEEADDPYLGRVVDRRYLVTRREASGGNSSVYRARALDGDPVVALKIARLGQPDAPSTSDVHEQMSREVRAVQMLENRHIVPIYEFLELERGAAVIVMEYIEGRTVDAIVEEEGPPTLDRTLRTVRQVASGLAEAHRSDLIHRDIKPANMMVGSEGERRAYILDFGIVRLQAAAPSTSGFLGTPLYASPEQIRMRELDARTDIYSLGATLFYLLTGEPPFRQEETMEVMRAHLDSTAPRIEERRAGAVPSELEELVGRMLAKDRAERPADLGEVLDRIEALESVVGEASGLENQQPRLDPGQTEPGFQQPVGGAEGDAPLERDRSGRTEAFSSRDEIQPALDHISEFGDAASSGQFTPAASDTSEFGSLSRDTDDFSIEEGEGSETQEGVQPIREENPSRRTGEDGSSQFRPDGGLDLLGTRSGGAFLLGDESGRLWLFDRADGSGPRLVTDLDTNPATAALGATFAWIGSEEGHVGRVRLEDGVRTVVASTLSGARVTSVAATSDDGVVAAGTRSGELLYRRCHLEAGWERRRGRRPVEAVNLAADGSRVVAARRGGLLELVRSADGSYERVELEESRSIRQLAVSASGDVLGVFYDDGTAQVVHGTTGRVVVDICETPSDICAGYFDSEGDLFGLALDPDGIAVWDLAAGRVVGELEVVSAVSRR